MRRRTTLQGTSGRYRIQPRPFAYGRASMLFQATDEQTQNVCIKLFPNVIRRGRRDEFMREFSVELTAQKRLVHPHILPVLDFGIEEGTGRSAGAPFIVLPMCAGGDLRERLRPRAFVPIDEASHILFRLAEAIDYAHAEGFLHGDIKPENILFADSGIDILYLSDFGMSKYVVIEEAFSSTRPPDFDDGGGSSMYMSPEQLSEGSQSPSSDIYSFALMAYELLTGKVPFDTKLPVFRQMSLKVDGAMLDPASALPTLPARVCDALRAGLDVSPANRPRSARELCRMLFSTKPPGRPRAKRQSPPERQVPLVFVSSTKTDARWLRRVRTHLKPLERHGDIEVWDDNQIGAGFEASTVTIGNLMRARVAVLLVSSAYLASEAIVTQQLPLLAAQSERDGLRLLILLISPVDIDSHRFLRSMRHVGPEGKTLTEMTSAEREKVLTQLVLQVKAAVSEVSN